MREVFDNITQMSNRLFQNGFSEDDEFFVSENPLLIRETEDIVDGFMKNCLASPLEPKTAEVY